MLDCEQHLPLEN